jgi:hypothetical protein
MMTRNMKSVKRIVLVLFVISVSSISGFFIFMFRGLLSDLFFGNREPGKDWIVDHVMLSEIKYTNSSAPLLDEQFIELKIDNEIENGSLIQGGVSTFDKDGNLILSRQSLPNIRNIGKGWRLVIFGNIGSSIRNETGKNVEIHLNLTSEFWLDSSGFIRISVDYSDVIATIECVAYGNYTRWLDPIYSWPSTDGGISVAALSDSLQCAVDLNNSSNWYSNTPTPGW